MQERLSVDSNVLMHFSKEESAFVKKIYSYKVQSEVAERFILTSFLNPREIDIIKSIFGQSEAFHYSFNGFAKEAERRRCFIYPSFYEATSDDFDVNCYSFKYNNRYINLMHSTILGKLLSLGIKREHIGDIYVYDEQVYIILSKEISPFIENEFNQIGKIKICLKKEENCDIINHDSKVNKILHAKSNRLDAIVSAISKKSRSESKEFILAGYVKVNHKVMTNISQEVKQNDMISIRRFGRVDIVELNEKQNKKGFVMKVLL